MCLDILIYNFYIARVSFRIGFVIGFWNLQWSWIRLCRSSHWRGVLENRCSGICSQNPWKIGKFKSTWIRDSVPQFKKIFSKKYWPWLIFMTKQFNSSVNTHHGFEILCGLKYKNLNISITKNGLSMKYKFLKFAFSCLR